MAVQAYLIYEKTLIGWFPLLAGALALLAAVVTLPLRGSWAWLTASKNNAPNTTCHLLLVTTFCCEVVLAGNYHLSGHKVHPEQVTILSKQIKERRATRQTGRFFHFTDGIKLHHYLRLGFKNGKEKTIRVSPTVYKRTRQGGIENLTLQRGAFGLSVITDGFWDDPLRP